MRTPFIINFHIFKSGGTHAEKIYATARDEVCGRGSSQNLARSFPLTCDRHYRKPWACGVHFTWPTAQLCLKRRSPELNLSLESDLVTSVVVLRDPVERFVSEFHHKERYHNKHCVTNTSLPISTQCKQAMGSLSGFRSLQSSTGAKPLQTSVSLPDYIQHNCTGGENRLTWTMSSRFTGSGSYAAYCRDSAAERGVELWADQERANALFQEARNNLMAVTIVGTLARLDLVFQTLSDAFNVSFDYSLPREYKQHQQYHHLEPDIDQAGGGDDSVPDSEPASASVTVNVSAEKEADATVKGAVQSRVKFDQRLLAEVVGEHPIRINWDSWVGRKLAHLGLKAKYTGEYNSAPSTPRNG
jgi:hypothetical protein